MKSIFNSILTRNSVSGLDTRKVFYNSLLATFVILISFSWASFTSAASPASSIDDGYTANGPVVSNAGDNDGFEKKVGTAPYADEKNDGNYMWSDATGSGNGSGCFNTDKDVHFFDFNMTGVPDNATIVGIKVHTNMWVNATSASPGVCASIMEIGEYGNSSTYSDEGSPSMNSGSIPLTTDQNTYQTFGGDDNLWGKTLSPSDIKGSNRLRVYLSMQSSNATRDFYIDHIYVEVYYNEASTTNIDITGTVYSDEGQNVLNTQPTVRVRVNGAGDYAVTAAADGTYSFTGANQVPVVAGDILTVHLDNNISNGVVVTRAQESAISGLNIYKDHVIVRDEDGTSLTNADLSFDSADDPGDIPYTLSGNNLTVTNSDLLVWTGKTFEPGGNITISTSGDLIVNGTLNAGGNITTVGDVIVNSGGTLALNTRNLVVNGGSITGAGTITSTTNSNSGITYTTDYTTTVNGSGSIGGGDYSFAHLKLGTSSAGTTIAAGSFTVKNKLTIESGHTFDASDDTITLGGVGSTFVNNGTLNENTSTFVYHGAGMYAQPETYYNLTLLPTSSAPFSELYPLVGTFNVTNNLVVGDGVVNGTVRNDVNDPIFNVDGNVTINNLVGLTMSDGGQAFNVAGSWTNSASAIFTHSNGTVTFDGSGTQTINTGNDDFYNLVFSGSGTYQLSSATTVSNDLTLTSGILEPEGNTLTVLNNFAISGTGELRMDTASDTLEIGNALTMSSGETAKITTGDVTPTPTITTSGALGTDHYSVTFSDGVLAIDKLSINGVDASGIVVGSGVSITNFNNVTLGDNFEKNGSDIMLDITGITDDLLNWVFPDDVTRNINVRANTSGTINLANATGAFAGEAYDCDSLGDCTTGTALVDWGTTIAVSGTLYSDAGSTAYLCSSNGAKTVSVVVDGVKQSAECSANTGAFSVSGVIVDIGDIMTIFVDDESVDASHVLMANTTDQDMTGVDLYINHVILSDRKDEAGGLSISDLYNSASPYDSVDEAGDLQFTISDASTFSVADGNTLYINATDTFTPGGNMTLDDVYIAGTLVATASDTYTVSGSWTNTGTYTDSSANVTVTFDSTSSETITTAGSAFYNLTLNGSGGQWTLQDTLTVSNDLTVTGGTLALGTQNMTVSGGDITGAGSITQTSGTVNLDGTGNLDGTFGFKNLTLGANTAGTTALSGTITVSGNLTVSLNHTLNGSGDLTVNENFSGAGTVTFADGTTVSHTTADSNKTFGGSANVWTFDDLAFAVSSGTPASDATGTQEIIVNGTLTIDTGATLQAGNRTWTLADGNNQTPLVVNGSFTANTSNIAYTGDYDAGNQTITALTYYDLTLGGSTAEFYDASSDTTVTRNLSINSNATLVGTDNWEVDGNVTGAGTITLTGGTFTQEVATTDVYSLGTTSGTNDWTFFNLVVENSANNTATVRLSSNADLSKGDLIVTGTLQIGNAADTYATTLDVTTNDRVIDANGDVTITSKGVLSASDSATFTVAGNWSNNGTFTHNNGTVTFDAGDSNNTLSGEMTGSNAFYNLVFNNAGGSWSTDVSVDIDNDLTIYAGNFTAPALGVDQSTLAFQLVIDPSIVNTISVKGNFANTGTFTHNSGLIKFTATDTGHTISFGDSEASSLWFSGSGGGWTFEGNNELEIYNLIIQRGTVNSAIDLRVTSGLGGLNTNVGTLNITNAVDFEWDIATSGTKGSSNFSTNWTFHNLIFSNSGASPISITSGWKSDSTITITGQLVVGDSGDTATTTLTLGAQTWVLSGSNPIVLNTTPAGAFDPGTSTIKLTGSGTVVVTDAVDYYNLTLDGAGTYQPPAGGDGTINVENDLNVTNGTFDLNTNDPAVTVAGSVTIGGTLQASNSSNLTVTGDWTQNSDGGFVHNSGTVVLTGTIESDVLGTYPTSFYNLTIDTNGKTVRFKKAQEVGIAGTLTAQGTNINRIILKSTSNTYASTADQWLLNLTGSTNLNWIIVANGGCASGSNSVSSNPNLINGGNNNNACWPFVNIGIQYQFADGDGGGGGTLQIGGGGGGGTGGGATQDTGGEGDGSGEVEAEIGGDSGGGGGAPSP